MNLKSVERDNFEFLSLLTATTPNIEGSYNLIVPKPNIEKAKWKHEKFSNFDFKLL